MIHSDESAAAKVSFIGREILMATLQQALKTRIHKVILLEGDAGIGKTTILERAAQLATDQGVTPLPIVDFYDTRVHSSQGLELAIADALDPEPNGSFSDYRQRRRKDPQAGLWTEFLGGYQNAVNGKHILLRFDTGERLAHEIDSGNVLQDCEIDTSGAPSWEWLLQRVGDLPNTTVLLAARPTPDDLLHMRLSRTYGDRLLYLKLEGFDLQETTAYFRAHEFGRQVADESPEMVQKIHLLSAGRPILIALAVDWLKRGVWDSSLYPLDVTKLQEWKMQAEIGQQTERERQAWEDIRRRFESALIGQIRSLATPLDVAVCYAALCRKGCNATLLARLMQVSREQAQELIAQLLTLSFVKPPRPGSRDMFFLHDEMYDLVEKYVWLPEWPDYSEQSRLDRSIIDWYTEQIDVYRERIRKAGGWQAQGQLRREQQLLMAERLYYQFDEDPRLGYREYSHLDEEAIAQREHEWDTWLRNEALWFMAHRAWRHGDRNKRSPDYPLQDPAWLKNGQATHSPAVDHDCRRRWVSRHIAHEAKLLAIRIAENLLAAPSLPEEPELYRGGVHIALATAQAYLGGKYTESAVANFDTGIQVLRAAPIEHQESWLHPYLLGSAHLYKGVALRGILSLVQATQAYSQAIRYFRQIGYRPGLAEATNNLAYVLARQGRLEPALSACNEGLCIRQELGDEHAIGLSLNTRGVIHERMAHPITAIHDSEQALDIFLEIGNTRGIWLAHINLGRAYRRKARSAEWGQKEDDFVAGEGHLQRAIDLQGDNADMFYRIEALNELGCLYRDWVATLHEQGERNGRALALLDRTEEHLRRAVELTEVTSDGQDMPLVVQRVDSLEDLARVYYWRARFEVPGTKEDLLDVMDGLLKQAESLAQEHLIDQAELRLIIGKVFFQRARLAQLRSQGLERIANCYGLAVGYAESYSLDAPEAHKFAADACDWLSDLDHDDAEQGVQVMDAALRGAGLHSVRLRDSVENVIKPLLDVGWPVAGSEANHG